MYIPRYFSLFSGIGGFELGVGNKAKCVGFSEIDRFAKQVYQSQFDHQCYGDITQIDERVLPDFDLLVGGFPCQAFSLAGKRQGFADSRGTMFFEIARIVGEKQPRLLLLENVKGLLSHQQGHTFFTILQTLDELGYDCQWQVLNSKDFGVPQNRERVFIVGHLRNTPRPQVFPIRGQDKELQVHQENSDNHKLSVVGKMVGEKWERFNESSRRVYGTNGVAPTIPTSAGGGHVPKILVHEATKAGYTIAELGDGNNLSTPIRKMRYGRGDEGVAQTLETGIRQHTLHGPQVRRLSPLECERLQGFPDGWTKGLSDTQRYKTLGNAVTVNVVRTVVGRLLS